MGHDGIDMEGDLRTTLSIWKMTVSIWKMTVSIWDISSLWALRAGGFRVDTNFGLRILVVDRSIAAGRCRLTPC